MIRRNKLANLFRKLITSSFEGRADKWEEKELAEIVGQSGSVFVKCRPFPFRQKAGGDERRFLYPDFGSDLRHELMDVQLADWGKLERGTGDKRRVCITLSLPKGIVISVEISSCRRLDKRTFFSDLADAVINALTNSGIRP